MTDAVLVSTARTGLAKSWRGAFNMTHGATLGGHVVRHAIERARIEAAEVDDILIGCAFPEGATGSNIARQIALRAGCPVSVPGHDRQPLLLVGTADHRAGGTARHRRRRRDLRRRRRRIDLVRAERSQQAHAARGVVAGAQAGDLLDHARHRGKCRQALCDLAREAGRVRRAEPAACRGGRGGRQIRRRDRADDGHHGRGRQGIGAHLHARGDDRGRRRHPRRYDL